MIYKYFIQIATMSLLGAAAVGVIIVVGFLVRVCWEGFMFGFYGLGYWL